MGGTYAVIKRNRCRVDMIMLGMGKTAKLAIRLNGDRDVKICIYAGEELYLEFQYKSSGGHKRGCTTNLLLYRFHVTNFMNQSNLLFTLRLTLQFQEALRARNARKYNEACPRGGK